MPTIPVSVWDQLAVVVVFAFLLTGIGYVLVKVFVRAISDINIHYSALLNEVNRTWQVYFDARSESTLLQTQKLSQQIEDISKILRQLVVDFEVHDHNDARRSK